MVTPSARCTLPLTVAPGYTLTKSSSTESWPIVELTWSWVWRPSVMLVVTRAPAARMHPSAMRLSPPTVAIGCTNTIGVEPGRREPCIELAAHRPCPDPDHEPRCYDQGSGPRCSRRSGRGGRHLVGRGASALAVPSSTEPSRSRSAPAAFIASTMSSTSRPKPPAPTTTTGPVVDAASANADGGDDTGATLLAHLRSAP